jgi:hypothetical protein
MLGKMLFVSFEYFEQIRRDDQFNIGARKEMRSLLKNKKDRIHDSWVKLQEVQHPLLIRAMKRTLPIIIPIY